MKYEFINKKNHVLNEKFQKKSINDYRKFQNSQIIIFFLSYCIIYQFILLF